MACICETRSPTFGYYLPSKSRVPRFFQLLFSGKSSPVSDSVDALFCVVPDSTVPSVANCLPAGSDTNYGRNYGSGRDSAHDGCGGSGPC